MYWIPLNDSIHTTKLPCFLQFFFNRRHRILTVYSKSLLRGNRSFPQYLFTSSQLMTQYLEQDNKQIFRQQTIGSHRLLIRKVYNSGLLSYSWDSVLFSIRSFQKIRPIHELTSYRLPCYTLVKWTLVSGALNPHKLTYHQFVIRDSFSKTISFQTNFSHS